LQNCAARNLARELEPIPSSTCHKRDAPAARHRRSRRACTHLQHRAARPIRRRGLCGPSRAARPSPIG